MVLTTPAFETEHSGDMSYLGVQPVGSMIFVSRWLYVFDSITMVSIFPLERCLFITSFGTPSLESLRAFFRSLLSCFPS